MTPCRSTRSRMSLDHQHTADRGIVLDYVHPALGPLKTIAMPIMFDAAPRDLKPPPPMHGEHSRAVLRELGYTAAEITLLAKAGVIVDGTP
jgi:crotonobetainyl-CoA:carnitine CoA-transferase CaiB-like acyl-CoA transferase